MGKVNIRSFLQEVCSVIREKGWISKSKRGAGKATVDYVIYPEGPINVLPVDEELASTALNWIRSLDVAGATDYLKTLKIVCNKDEVAEMDYGYAASLIRAYENTQKQNVANNSQHIGNVDDEVIVKVRILDSSPTKFGWMYKLADAGGNILTVFRRTQDFGNIGDVFKLTGIIKEHRTFKNSLTTIIKRAYREELKKEVQSTTVAVVPVTVPEPAPAPAPTNEKEDNIPF